MTDWSSLPSMSPWNAPIAVLPELGISGKHFTDHGQPYAMRWVSMLYALQPARTGEDWERFFAWARMTGFNGVRVFCGNLEQVNQTNESARKRLPALLDMARDFGFAVEATAVTGSAGMSRGDIEAHVSSIAAICKGRACVTGESGNELEHGSQSDAMSDPDFLLDLDTAWALAGFRGPVAFGAPATDEPDADGYYLGAGGSHCTAHLDRGRPFWAQIRRVRELKAVADEEGVPCIDNERTGAAEEDGSVTGKQRINDPVWFFTAGCLDMGFLGGGIHHSDAGLNAILPGPVQQQCADAEVEGSRLVEVMLGGPVGTYYNAGHEGSPVGAIPQADWDRTLGKTDGRCYSFTNGNQGATVVLGLPAGTSLDIPWANGWHPDSQPVVKIAHDGSRVEVWRIVR